MGLQDEIDYYLEKIEQLNESDFELDHPEIVRLERKLDKLLQEQDKRGESDNE